MSLSKPAQPTRIRFPTATPVDRCTQSEDDRRIRVRPTPNVSGERVADVAVAIIDPSGFDTADARIRSKIGATRSFASNGPLSITNGGTNRHGTESAATVSRIAPGANLYLANFATAHDFTRAIEWAIDRDVDVIVAPVTFAAKPNDGSSPVSRAVSRAVDQGIPVVVPVGNTAKTHWEGTYRGGGWLRVAGDDTRLHLRGDARPVQVWLWWNRSDAENRHDFRVILYRDDGGRTTKVAASQEYPKGPVGTNQVLYERIRTNDLLTESIGNGTHFVRVTGPADAVHRVELVATNHRLDTPVPRGSLLAPATAAGNVIAVGAANRSTGVPLETSSHGPTNDGRLGIDLLAPGRLPTTGGGTFTGTSAAAAYTGGVVTAMKAIDPTLTPAEAEGILETSADSPVEAVDVLARGHGMLDPDAAIACTGRTSGADDYRRPRPS